MAVQWDSKIWVAQRIAADTPLSTLLVQCIFIIGLGCETSAPRFSFNIHLQQHLIVGEIYTKGNASQAHNERLTAGHNSS